MVQSGKWVFGIERHNHFTGIQKFIARSRLQKIARAIGARIDRPTRWSRPALQSIAAERSHRVAGRSYIASKDAFGGDRLFRSENERDFRARVAERADRRADHSGAYRAAGEWPVSGGVSSESGNGRTKLSADRAGLLGFVRAIRAQKSRSVALDV